MSKFFDVISKTEDEQKRDQIEGVVEEAEMVYRRQLEDMNLKLTQLNRKRKTLLSNIRVDDFNANGFVDSDISTGLEILNIEKKIAVIKKQYDELFGK